MSLFIKELIKTFVYTAKDLHGEYVESWLEGKVNDYDMDMILINEKKLRALTYKRILEWK